MIRFEQKSIWQADEGDARCSLLGEDSVVETNPDCISAPSEGVSSEIWRSELLRYRERAIADDYAHFAVRYRGVRAWLSLDRGVAKSLALRPGELVRVTMKVKPKSGSVQPGIAFEGRDFRGDHWRWWSGLIDIKPVPLNSEQTVTLEARVPQFDTASGYANILIGQDESASKASAEYLIRDLSLEVPKTGARESISLPAGDKAGIDLSLYDRKDLTWTRSNFSCTKAFLFDSSLYDRKTRTFKIKEMIDRMEREFGGVDSVLLWQAYPRIGVDQRNQFDFFRDMPGGLKAIRKVVDQLHQAGIKAILPYNPWDVGTRREDVSDSEALAHLIKELDADGIFLDTMTEAPSDLRVEVDKARPGVLLEPELRPQTGELAICNGSWAQWPLYYDLPSLMRLKWIEPRHIQHQIRRWHGSHEQEIETAFFNGSGMMVWENIFGSWNPWQDSDKDLWARSVRILRLFSDVLASKQWQPYIATLNSGLFANRWTAADFDLVLIANRTGGRYFGQIARVGDLATNMVAYELFSGKQLDLTEDGTLRGEIGRLGAILITSKLRPCKQLALALEAAKRPTVSSSLATLGHEPKPVRTTKKAGKQRPPTGMVFVPSARVHMLIEHERRECACYPDPGLGPEQQQPYVFAGSHAFEQLRHDYRVDVGSFWIDETLVTNEQFYRFLKKSDYRPKDSTNFLKHWKDGKYAEEIADHPVVYVDLDDARAYARWAGKRLPTEPEWQFAAQGTDGRAWPWGDRFDPARCNGAGSGTTPVRAYPTGRSPFGCYDMSGNLYQWVEAERDDGHTRYTIIRGGSYFDAKGSQWYVHGAAHPLNYHAKFLLLYPGLDRCATIGFRCVKDAY